MTRIMDIKTFYNKHYIASHLTLLALTVVLLCIGVGFGLDLYTHHGQRIVVPDLKGMDFNKAYDQMQEMGVIVQVGDSGYNKQLPANAILAQTPGSGMAIKEGHVIYVTVNSPSSPTFALPDIIDNSSLREAEARLSAMGFRLTAPQEVEGEKDWVYGITSRGRRVSNGDRISIDYPLTLLVGRGVMEDPGEIAIDEEFTPPSEGEVDEFVEVTE
jgi:beta-lactam-binding protein with PASTA domain